ncbi:MAG: Cys-tRNA(Pro) deacylase [Proteobacteria bacterium]|nr:MAG: Cys-tRNA(Pro) deacylase [Pseudomonadota bacterium]PIE40398.1 MAG: Cys-tRNA(Pro) deacylase [Gammaproteobacteria bacterium]
MTPAIDMLERQKVAYDIHEYTHDASTSSYGLEAAEKLGVESARVFKTLVVSLNGDELVVGIVPVCTTLNLKKIARAARAKKARMADKLLVQRVTGYVPGGVSPLGQKKRLRTFVDVSAQAYQSVYVSAGRRGLEIELSPEDLLRITAGSYHSLSAD